MPAEDLTFRVGETRRIAHPLSADTAFLIGGVTLNLYDSAGTAVISGGTASADDAASDTEHEVYYLWSPAAAGDYTYRFLVGVGDQVIGLPQDGFGTVTVLPVTSKYDRWAVQVRSLIQDSAVADGEALLSYRDLMRSVDEAVRAFELVRPRRIEYDLAGADAYEYNLSLLTGWITGRSKIIEARYPWGPTAQSRPFLGTFDVEVDEYAATPKLRFTRVVPATGQTVRLLYEGGYTLSHTVDDVATYEPRMFEAIATYAAGRALQRLADKSAGTAAPGQASDVINYRTKQQEYRQQGLELERLGRQGWRVPTCGL